MSRSVPVRRSDARRLSFVDMADEPMTTDSRTNRSQRGLRCFAFILSALLIVLAAVTGIALVAITSLTTGDGTITVDSTIAAPYSVELEGGTRIDVASDGSMTAQGGEPAGGPEPRLVELVELPTTLQAPVRLADVGLASRLVAAATALMLIGAGWVGLVSLRRVVRSALSGNPFDARNAGRLRWCGLALLSVPVTGWVSAMLLAAPVDESLPGVRAVPSGPDWGVYVLVGVGLLALAEVFRSGAVLQDLEMRTV
jgi:hypothetical protein